MNGPIPGQEKPFTLKIVHVRFELKSKINTHLELPNVGYHYLLSGSVDPDSTSFSKHKLGFLSKLRSLSLTVIG